MNTTFHNNKLSGVFTQKEEVFFQPGEFYGAGGVAIGINDIENLNCTISNCTFLWNNASDVRHTKPSQLPIENFLEGHGGAISITFNNSNGSTLTIDNTTVQENFALYSGGGLYVSLNISYNNTIIVRASEFTNNYCRVIGGAIRMSTQGSASRNSLVVEDTMFTNNSAEMGGGACSVILRVSMWD